MQKITNSFSLKKSITFFIVEVRVNWVPKVLILNDWQFIYLIFTLFLPPFYNIICSQQLFCNWNKNGFQQQFVFIVFLTCISHYLFFIGKKAEKSFCPCCQYLFLFVGSSWFYFHCVGINCYWLLYR